MAGANRFWTERPGTSVGTHAATAPWRLLAVASAAVAGTVLLGCDRGTTALLDALYDPPIGRIVDIRHDTPFPQGRENVLAGYSDAWRFQGQCQLLVTGELAIHDGAVYFPAGERLYALDLNTGLPRWEFSTDQRLFGLMCHEDLVFTYGAGRFYALQAGTGKPAWPSDREYDFSGWQVHNGIVYAYDMWQEKVLAVEARTGSIIWKRRIKKEGGSGVLVGMRGDDLLVMCHRGTQPCVVTAYRTRKLKRIWKRSAPDSFGFPTVGGESGVVYTCLGKIKYEPGFHRPPKVKSDDLRLHAIDSATGEVRWLASRPANRRVPIVESNGIAYFPTFNDKLGDCLYAVDIETGKVKWALKRPYVWLNPNGTRPLIHRGVVYFTLAEKLGPNQPKYFTVALDCGTGEWLGVSDKIYSSRIYAHENMLIVWKNEALVAYSKG